MILRIFAALVIIIAVGIGALALILPRDQLIKLIIFRDFFDISLPILGFGALVKYLCSCSHHCGSCHKDKGQQ